jgi:glycosyltransferase involved in cell wall biosynthesis
MTYYAARMKVDPLMVPGLGRDAGLLNNVRAFAGVCRMLFAEQPDIVHTHTTQAGVLGRVAVVLYNAVRRLRRRPRARVVHTFHGHVFHGYYSRSVSMALVLMERLFARFTDRILAVSAGVKSDLVVRYRLCPADKVLVVPLGLDFGWVDALPVNTGRLRARFGIPDSAVVVGIVGRLTGIKNHGLLFDALRALGGLDVRVVVVGDGERRETLERAVREAGLRDRVVFTGWQEDPAEIYADLDIVCLTSLNEGTPVALIEAMAAGRPVVATRVGGVPDLVVGHGVPSGEGFEVFANGILVPPGKPATLAAALAFLAADPERRRAMGRAGEAAVRVRFAKERLFEAMEAVYDELLGGPSGRQACGHS